MLIAIQWIPSHSKIPGNELADTTAKQTTGRPDTSCRIAYGSICSRINVLTKDQPHNHEGTKLVYSALSQDRIKDVTSRSDQTLLARLCSGHFLGLRAYQHRIDPTTSRPVTVAVKRNKIWSLGSYDVPPQQPSVENYLVQMTEDWTASLAIHSRWLPWRGARSSEPALTGGYTHITSCINVYCLYFGDSRLKKKQMEY